jgi:hypothetical protein
MSSDFFIKNSKPHASFDTQGFEILQSTFVITSVGIVVRRGIEPLLPG